MYQSVVEHVMTQMMTEYPVKESFDDGNINTFIEWHDEGCKEENVKVHID